MIIKSKEIIKWSITLRNVVCWSAHIYIYIWIVVERPVDILTSLLAVKIASLFGTVKMFLS